MIQPSLKGVRQWLWKGKASVNPNPESNPAPTPGSKICILNKVKSLFLNVRNWERDHSFLFSFGATGTFPSNQILRFSISKLQGLLRSAKL